ncbi:MAG: hypothetical protein ACFFDN_37025 [Candidatus Hodarchaeota archaeon]
MMDQLFFDFEIGRNDKFKMKKQNYGHSIDYLVFQNGNDTKFFTSEIEKLGPRPETFPENFMIERIDEEFRLLHILLSKINDNKIVFCKSEKLRQLYYRCKRFGIREGYIPKKIRLLKVKIINIEYDASDLEINNILDHIEKISKSYRTHWNILHQLYMNVELNSLLIKNNGFHRKAGIFEIILKKSGKKNLLGYFNGM